jgi:tetratricopeptide (TPR) repeat protein
VIIPLQLRHSDKLDAEPTAWFLPGDSAARWLEELAQSGLSESETRLFLVPKSPEDRSPAGLLVVPVRADSLRHQPSGLACRLIAVRLFVPVDALLHPPVADEEVRTLCPLPINFLHPAFGLSGFEMESTLRLWHLLDLPEERGDDWNFARPGAPALPELQTIMLAQPPAIEDVFGGAEEEIGIEPPLDLPPAPDEPKENPLAESGRSLRRLFAKGVAGAMRQIPHTGHRRTWVNDIEDWANRQLRGVNQQLEKIRNKELNRLLHLFDTDPEAALRHALPMSAFAHRGIAPPGGLLGTRLPNFDLSQLGGRAADFWNVPIDLQEVLRRRYREMADREMQLGRHRRAAYIYAELLGDLVSAAHALKQGKHFREAALLYDEHLKNPLEAARCLADGGLLVEAIERYEKLERWLDVADLQDRLGNRAAAEFAARRVVNECVAKDDILAAAKLVEQRLHATNEALEMLLQAWPRSRQAASCVGAAFELLARLGRHEVALERVAQFAREPVPPSHAVPLLTALGKPSQDYPHEMVRHRVADFSRVLIARQLSQPQLATDETGRLMECLVRLAPQDRLLARDANRHLLGRRETDRRLRRIAPTPANWNKPEVVRRFELPRQIDWVRLRNESNWFYAVGISEKRLTLARGIWEGEIQSMSWPCAAGVVRSGGLIFEPTGEQGRAVTLALPGMPHLALQKFPATDLFFGQQCMVGTPHWLTNDHYPIAYGEESVWTAHVAVGRAVLSCHDIYGRLQRTIDVTDDLLADAERGEKTRLCLVAVGNSAAIALGNRAVLTRSDGGVTRLELPGQVIGLHPTLPYTRVGLAILLNHGAALHWIGAPGLIELDRDITAPMATFVPGGPLVLLSDVQMILLDVDSRAVQKVTRVEVTGQRPMGVSATSSPGQFAVLGAKGEMTVYRMPQ